MRGHSEHRSHAWKPEEIYNTCVQAIEGRCNRRTKVVHDYKIAIKEFLARVEIILINELSRALEQSNEPDRVLIGRLNRALSTSYLKDDRPSLYHVHSPSRPQWKTWNLDHEDPAKMAQIIEAAKELLRLPRAEIYEEDLLPNLRDRSEWDARAAAEVIAIQLGTHIHHDTASTAGLSRATTPDGRTLWSSDGDLKRRGISVDSISRRTSSGQLPLEPSVFVRDRPSVMSFREKSVPLEEAESPDHSLANGAVSMGALSTYSNIPYQPPTSAMSTLPPYPADDTLNTTLSSNTTPVPNSSPAPGSSSNPNGKFASFGENFLTRPICVQSFQLQGKPPMLALSDSCGGVYITTPEGEITDHILIKNSSASSVAVDEKNAIMYVSGNKKLDAIPCPKDPKIELSRTRWLTVGPRGHLFMTSGDNLKSALWVYMRSRKAWKTLKESRKSRYQYLSVAEDQSDYKAVVLLTCDAANNRLLLFVVDSQLSLINEYDLSVTYNLGQYISSPASAIVDKTGHLLIMDYANGKVQILLSGEKGVRKLREVTFLEPLQPQMALGLTVLGDYVYVACFSTREVRRTRYLENGKFRQFHPPAALADAAAAALRPKAILANGRSPMGERRANSVPRPPNTHIS
ncbi:unnamed protein product, partial [Mesorhabditis spiculigera]